MKAGDTIITSAPTNPYIGHPELVDYTWSRSAIVAFSRHLAKEHAAAGIRVNAVCPGLVCTPLVLEKLSKEEQKKFTTPMGRLGQPSEIATCFVFLAGPDSSFVSGQSLYVNGGVLVGR
jgi:NAD(P)-dependent dehydrogenase (short-subunit alcohol dehydrogenase family)